MFGIWGHKQAAEITYYGLHAMQHRGQDGAGIVVNDGSSLHLHKGEGLVNDVFKHFDFTKFKGFAAIGNIRNQTQNDKVYDNVQPHVFHSLDGSMSIAHNGRIINADAIRRSLEDTGSIFQTTSDTELLAHLMRRNGIENFEDSLIEALQQLVGAYGFLLMTNDKMYVALDPRGIRPLSIGRLGDSYVVASETCAFSIVGATFEREVKPGELIIISHDGIESKRFLTQEKRSLCAMEYVYFSRPDSDLNYVNVHSARKRMGIELGKEHPVFDADVVTGVPDSSISAAIGYAEQCGLPYEMGVIKNRYIGRTFIQPSEQLRNQGVKMKLSPVKGVVKGKRVVMIDDSIVRGTTSQRIVTLLREAGAKEVHVRISSPPIENPCYYGIDMSTKKELIAANNKLEQMRKLIGADSLQFLSQEGMKKAILKNETVHQGICAACMTGSYPVLEEDDVGYYRTY
ncbi:MAG TPA: amidophosphoribosyltransferase [Pseudogracilibacillus sp.]|nr:amidophosphoribosyltransferase [Pseudogracilibacillus sp.]